MFQQSHAEEASDEPTSHDAEHVARLEKQLDQLMQKGYRLVRVGQTAAACDRWLEAWELIRRMTTPDVRSVAAFDRAHPGLTEPVFNWCSDLEMELANAGLDEPSYHKHRLRYAREFLDRFPDVGTSHHVNFLRAQGDALWNLGRRDEAEACYEKLVERFPDEGWGYIAWSDQYWLWGAPEAKEYEKAAAILKRALANADLNDRRDVMDRLTSIRQEWNQSGRPGASSGTPPPAQRPGRNAPCWCGSGKKYKHCHWRSDQAR